MTRALYHAFKLYIKIHGETFCCLTFLGGGGKFRTTFSRLGRLEVTLQREHSCFSQQHLQKIYCCQSAKKLHIDHTAIAAKSPDRYLQHHTNHSLHDNANKGKQGQCKTCRIPLPKYLTR